MAITRCRVLASRIHRHPPGNFWRPRASSLTGTTLDMPTAQRLRRSRRHRLIAGVCDGIGERLGWSPLLVRILFALGAVLPVFPGAVVYVILWLVLPKADA